MSEFIRISVYRELTGLSLHVEHMLGAMPRPRVVRRRELRMEAIQGTPGWAAALDWAAKALQAEARRLRSDPTSVPQPLRRPPGGTVGGDPESQLRLDLP